MEYVYIPVALLCLVGTPDSECQVGKRDVRYITGLPQNTPISCLMEATEMLSRSAFRPSLDDEYKYNMVVKCPAVRKDHF